MGGIKRYITRAKKVTLNVHTYINVFLYASLNTEKDRNLKTT